MARSRTLSASRTLRSPRPLDVRATWGTLRRGAGDPTWLERSGVLWRGLRRGSQPVTLALRTSASTGQVEARAWGRPTVVEDLLDGLGQMLGEGDDASGFVPHHPVVAASLRAHPGWRMPHTGQVIESLLPAVIEQKVTGQEAFAGWRRLVRRFGDPAPGPAAALGLMVPPDVPTWAALPSWEWLRAGVSPQRSDTIARVLRVAERMEEAPRMPAAQARALLCAVPGVGVWTAAETAQRAWGDADAVSFGDYHVARNIGWALAGDPDLDDAGLVGLLEPYRGHRYRVQRLLGLAGVMRPRHGPRMAPRSHLPVR